MDVVNLNAAKTAEVVKILKAYETDDLLLGHGETWSAQDRMAMALCMLQLEEQIMRETYNKKESN